MSLPCWLKKRAPREEVLQKIKGLLRSHALHTVCEEARCPNMGECFQERTATFLILGDRCTRNCRFCAVKKENPLPLASHEPRSVAQAVQKLGLRYVVITSVTRDDLSDGGAEQFTQTMREIRRVNGEGIRIEILIPDFQGSLLSLKKVMEAKPDVLNHNLETVSHLYPQVRPQADYERSLKLLKRSKELDSSIYTKSGLMVGLGESSEEVIETMKDLREVRCDILTIGQYLRPSSQHLAVEKFVTPERFKEYGEIGQSLGFSCVASSPFVRSSYQAEQALDKAMKKDKSVARRLLLEKKEKKICDLSLRDEAEAI